MCGVTTRRGGREDDCNFPGLFYPDFDNEALRLRGWHPAQARAVGGGVGGSHPWFDTVDVVTVS